MSARREEETGASAPVTFTFEVIGSAAEFAVSGVTVRERLSAPFEGSVVVRAPPSLSADDLLDRPVALTLRRDGRPHRFVGVVTSVEDNGLERNARVFDVAFGPALATLAQRAHRRAWRGVDALRIVREVLDDVGMYPGDALVLPGPGGHAPAARESCAQLGESDLDFVRRLLAEEGLLFTFGDEQGDDVLVLADEHGRGQPRVVAATGEGLRRLDAKVEPVGGEVLSRDWDRDRESDEFTRSGVRASRSGEGAQAPGDARVVRGEGDLTDMGAGRRFGTEGGGEYVLTAVLHLGDATARRSEKRYRNLFTAVAVGPGAKGRAAGDAVIVRPAEKISGQG